MIRAMCEQFVARAAEPFRLDELWPYAERLERYGLAGFSWGASWLAAEGGLRTYRQTMAFRDDPERDRVGAEETTSVLVHLRRPSRLSTLQMPDTQPFDDPAGRFAFAHNGDLRDHKPARARYRAQGRIRGRADSEVGQRWLEDAWSDDEPVAHLLASLHDSFGGDANLAVLTKDGVPHHYAGNAENPVFAFRLGRIGLASTAIYSVDRSLFRYAAHGATDRTLARLHSTIALDERGHPIEAGPGRRLRAGEGS
jgi:glutamine phosphoribosylpyrophosphate amidotransferase